MDLRAILWPAGRANACQSREDAVSAHPGQRPKLLVRQSTQPGSIQQLACVSWAESHGALHIVRIIRQKPAIRLAVPKPRCGSGVSKWCADARPQRAACIHFSTAVIARAKITCFRPNVASFPKE